MIVKKGIGEMKCETLQAGCGDVNIFSVFFCV